MENWRLTMWVFEQVNEGQMEKRERSGTMKMININNKSIQGWLSVGDNLLIRLKDVTFSFKCKIVNVDYWWDSWINVACLFAQWTNNHGCTNRLPGESYQLLNSCITNDLPTISTQAVKNPFNFNQSPPLLTIIEFLKNM